MRTLLFKLYDLILFFIEHSQQRWPSEYEEEEVRTSLFRKGRSHVKIILQLASILIKADGQTQKEELAYVKQKIAKDFSKNTAEAWVMRIENHLEEYLDLDEITRQVNKSFSQSTKIQLLHFLAGIATKDAMLTVTEFKVLQKIGMRIRIPYKTLTSILALYNYITEEQANENRERKNKPIQPTDWHLKRAYTILELSENATDKEVKKMYRKLVKLHHPDRVIHMGPKFQKQAEEKFKQISEAYKAIKNNRGLT